jgi:hypothetical protein
MKPRRGNNYLEQLKRSQAAKGQQAAETPKPTSQMTEAELDAEVARLEREVRASKERTVELGREELAGQGSKHPIFTKRRRPPWR